MSENKFEPSGVLVVDKPEGLTSHDVVGKIRRLYATRRVGHTGTLDPMATGVLVILVGRAAKAAEYLVADSKQYIAGLRLGLTTDTEDITGKIITECSDIPNSEQVDDACKKFVGKISQIPPMYSAIKVGGKKLYELAREGVEIEREAREIEISSLISTPTDKENEYALEVECSSGTYVRTLCADIGKSLGCGGAMSALRRTRAGSFDISAAHTLEQLEQMTPDERIATLIPTESLFSNLPRVILPEFYEKLCKNGCEIYQNKIGTHYPTGTRVRLCSHSGAFFALAETRSYDKGIAFHAIKRFDT